MKETLKALSEFPDWLEITYSAFPDKLTNYCPISWEGIPSEHFTPIEHICHMRDIEVGGYQVRFLRTLKEVNPTLTSIDGEALARQRRYEDSVASEVLAAFRFARKQTVERIASMTSKELARTAEFEEYGRVTVKGLIHFLCSHDQQHLSGLQWLLGKVASHQGI